MRSLRAHRARGHAAWALAAVAAVAGACTRTTPSGRPEEVVAAAPDKTVAAGAAEVRIDRFGLRAVGVVDLAAGAVRLTVSSSAGRGGELEVLAVGDRVWTRPPGSSTWEVADLAGAGLLGLPGGLRSADPRAALDLVRGTSRVVVFGGLQVQSTSTIRYDAYSDPIAASKAARPSVAARLEELGRSVDHPVRVDVYVDVHGRVRRLEVPEDLVNATPATRSDGNRISATIDFLRFGVDPGDLRPPD